MLKDEAKIISELLSNESNKMILNVCSSDEEFWKNQQPYIWQDVMAPLIQRSNKVINLDMKASKGVNIIADCTNMRGVKEDSFDIVLFTSGVEHIIDVQSALNEIRRALKKDGYMICSAPGVYPKHDDPIDTMLRLPTLESWEALLGDAWVVRTFRKTEPMPAKAMYRFPELVYATIIEAYSQR